MSIKGSEPKSDDRDLMPGSHECHRPASAKFSAEQNLDMQRLRQFVAECELFFRSNIVPRNGMTYREAHAVTDSPRASMAPLPSQARGTATNKLKFMTWPYAKLRRAWAIRRDARLIQEYHLFDESYYSRRYPDAVNHSGGLIDHFLRFGYLEGRNPHPLFDTAYYLNQNPDVARQAVNPLIHYMRFGSKEGRNPHPYFNTRWYLNQLERGSETTPSPIDHYLKIGASLQLSPSPDFDTAFYIQRYPDVVLHNINPLLHYLEYGIAEGRLATRSMVVVPASTPVLDASIDCLKFDVGDGEVALLVTHSPDGYLKPYLMHYITKLRENGISVILIVAADNQFNSEQLDLSCVDGLFIRENVGFDFAAWAHVIRLHPELLDLDRLYILNDSIFGPTNDTKFQSLLSRIRQNDADLIGITDSYELGWHIQSYFLVVRRRLLVSRTMRSFIDNIVSYPDKDDVIKEFEVKFAQAICAAGFRCSVLFPSAEVINVTLLHWKRLLHSGFPFVKVMAIRDGFGGGDKQAWEETLQRDGFDITLVERTLLLSKVASMRSLMAASRAAGWHPASSR